MIDTEIKRSSEEKVLNEFYETELQEKIGTIVSDTEIHLFLTECKKIAKIYNPASDEMTIYKYSDTRNYVILKNKKAIAIDGTRLKIIFE